MLFPSQPEFRSVYKILTVLLLVIALTSCQHETPWQTRSIAHFMPDLAFTLTDQNGHTVHANDYTGKVVMLFFGFSHCMDTCPLTLGKLSAILNSMGKQAEQTRVLFVSIDPNRDTPARLATYTRSFSPEVIGLTGTPDQLRDLTRRYRVAFSYGKGYPHGQYPVYHSGAVFVFDGSGKIQLLFTQDDGVNDISADLQHLVSLQPSA